MSLSTFPPFAGPTFFNNTYLNTNIVTYLNTSTTSWPSTGFGKTPVYQGDQVIFTWPENTAQATRNWHCMPCHQRLDSKDEGLNWDACRYSINDNLPELISATTDTYRSQSARGIDANENGKLPVAEDQALMCTFGIPETQPYLLTQPFRFVNVKRNTALKTPTYVFNAAVPEGMAATPSPSVPYGTTPTAPRVTPDSYWKSAEEKRHSAYIRGIVGGTLGGALLLGMLICACCYRKKRKNQKIAAECAAGEQDLSKEEEAAGEALPGYEGPPAYVERVDASAQK